MTKHIKRLTAEELQKGGLTEERLLEAITVLSLAYNCLVQADAANGETAYLVDAISFFDELQTTLEAKHE